MIISFWTKYKQIKYLVKKDWIIFYAVFGKDVLKYFRKHYYIYLAVSLHATC